MRIVVGVSELVFATTAALPVFALACVFSARIEWLRTRLER